MNYLLWSGRLNGWLTNAGTYVSTVSEARRFSHEEAILMCKRHYRSSMVEYGMIPVAEADALEISK